MSINFLGAEMMEMWCLDFQILLMSTPFFVVGAMVELIRSASWSV